jgi:uncharacterized protein involved in outer membrane biogenesis
MKKWILRIAIVIVALIIIGIVVIGLTLDGAVKKGVETVGPQVAKVDVKLDGVSLSILSGSGTVKGLVVGNPQGYKTAHAISVGRTSVAVAPGSVFSDKIVVKSIRIEEPQITIEVGPGGTNLKVIQNNVAEATGGNEPAAKDAKPAESGPSKKLQVDDVLITGGKITVGVAALGGKVSTIPLPELHFTNLGGGPEGITPAELATKILGEISTESVKAAAGAVADLGKEAVGTATKTATDTVNKAAESIGNLFKKKE